MRVVLHFSVLVFLLLSAFFRSSKIEAATTTEITMIAETVKIGAF